MISLGFVAARGLGWLILGAILPAEAAPLAWRAEQCATCQIMGEEGRPLQAQTVDGARPFTKEEMERICRASLIVPGYQSCQ